LRNRGAAVLIENGKVALIKRVRDESEYYVFPGGGVEQGETLEVATVREAVEELGLSIKIRELIDTVQIFF
jgi:8-oxo-dGTP diphosphatase